MARVTLVLGHPDASGQHLCGAIAEAYREGVEANGHQVAVVDVSQEDVPFLRSREE